MGAETSLPPFRQASRWLSFGPLCWLFKSAAKHRRRPIPERIVTCNFGCRFRAHGSSQQRVRWFKRGLETGSVKECDTFKTAQL